MKYRWLQDSQSLPLWSFWDAEGRHKIFCFLFNRLFLSKNTWRSGRRVSQSLEQLGVTDNWGFGAPVQQQNYSTDHRVRNGKLPIPDIPSHADPWHSQPHSTQGINIASIKNVLKLILEIVVFTLETAHLPDSVLDGGQYSAPDVCTGACAGTRRPDV